MNSGSRLACGISLSRRVGRDHIPFSGAVLRTELPVTSFLRTSSFWPCSRRGAISACIFVASGFCFFCTSSI